MGAVARLESGDPAGDPARAGQLRTALMRASSSS